MNVVTIVLVQVKERNPFHKTKNKKEQRKKCLQKKEKKKNRG